MSVNLFVSAAEKGDIEEMTKQLVMGVDVNGFDDEDWTALMHASHSGRKAAVLLLLSREVNMNLAHPADGRTALMLACRNGQLCIVELLVKSGADHSLRSTKDGCTALLYACSNNHFSIVEFLLFSGANPSPPNADGWTALMFACNHGQQHIAELLVKCGADHTLRSTKDGWTALMFACYWDSHSTVELLLNRGADHSICDSKGWTAFMHACSKGHLSTAELLLKSGADPNHEDSDGNTALHYACERSVAAVEFLLLQGASHACRNKDGDTPLHYACERSQLLAVEALIRHGASHTCRNKNDKLAVQLIKHQINRAKIEELIVSLSADVLERAVQRAIAMNEKSWNRSKIMLVGQGRVGKSSLARVILGHGFNAESPSTCGMDKFEVNVSTGIVGSAQDNSRYKWLEYKKKGSHLNNALASMAHMISNQSVDIPDDLASIDIEGATAVTEADIQFSAEKFSSRSEVDYGGNSAESPSQQVLSPYNSNSSSPLKSPPQIDDSDCPGSDAGEINSCCAVDVGASSVQSPLQQVPSPPVTFTEVLAVGTTSAPIIMQENAAHMDIEGATSIDDADINAGKLGSTEDPSLPFLNRAPDSSYGIAAESDLQSVSLPFDMHMIARTEAVDDSDLVLSVFDFGGQEIFNCIHPFFLTQNGAYLVVFNMEECLDPASQQECLRFLMFWVNSIAMHTKRGETTADMSIADIYIVGTHGDHVSNKSQWLIIGEVLANTLSASVAWPFVIKEDTFQFFPIDCTLGLKDPIARKLMQIVESRLKTSPSVLSKRPLTWFSVLDDLEAAGKEHPVISLNDAEAIALKYSIGTEELNSLLRFLREMGVLLWYEEPSLRNSIILDPVAQFIVPVTRIICDPELHSKDVHFACRCEFPDDVYQTFRNTGVVTRELLHFILKFGGHDATLLIEMMQTYGLLVHWQPVNVVEGDTQYLVPSLFAGDEASNIATLEKELYLSTEIRIPHECRSNWTGSRTFILVFSLDPELAKKVALKDLERQCFLPTGIFEQLVCKALIWCQNTPDCQLSKCNLHKQMVEIFFGNVRFCMTLRSSHNCIQVDVIGHGQEAHSILSGLTAFVIEILSKTGCSIHMEPFVPARPANSAHFISAHSSVAGALRPDNLLSSANFDWIICPSKRDVYDVFLSYRWNEIDVEFVQKAVDHLQDYSIGGMKIAVHDGLECQGEDAVKRSQNFKSLMQSTLFVPIVSSRALQCVLDHDPATIENVLFEWIASLLFIRLRSAMPDKNIALEKILPIVLPEDPKCSMSAEVIPHIPKISPTASVAAVLACFDDCGAELPPFLRTYATTVTLDQIVTELLEFMYTKGDDVKKDKNLPCRVAYRAVGAVEKTEAFAIKAVQSMEAVAWSQLDVMSLLTGRLEKYRKDFEEHKVTVEVLSDCSLNEPAALPKRLGVAMKRIDAKMFLTALKKALGRYE